MKRHLLATAVLAVTASVLGYAPPSLAVDPSRIENADKNPNDWLTYHGSYKSWHYSALDQINTSNVKNLQVAWMHSPGRVTRGLQSFPLVADGVLYYTGPYSRVFALDAATGQVIWSFIPKLDEDLIAAQTHTPYTAASRWGTATSTSARSTAGCSPSTCRPASRSGRTS
jgi:alcohol dehydrogenase (cytochrome c)